MGVWREFFDSHAERYEENAFTHHTVEEIKFFLGLFVLPVGARILDVGCGTGRHSIELARRGYRVVGLDRSEKMLDIARRNAEGVDVSFVNADATTFTPKDLELSGSDNGPFDAAICLCEGAVGLIEQGEDAIAHDQAIFENVANVLRPNAPFLLTCLNGYSIIRQMNDELVAHGRFDPATMIANYEDEINVPGGSRIMKIYERLFIAPEVVRMLTDCGFRVDNVYGGTAGHWAPRPVGLDEVEAMFVCRKKG
jgi:SAM-dependent methyltransferase